MSAQTLSSVDAAPLTEASARALTTRIRTQVEHLDDLLLTAWRGRVWTALGHPTWGAWVSAELGAVRLRLPVEQRRAVTAAWRREGMSQRAIATGLGVSKGTVATDLADVPVGAGLAVVVSLDGRRRPAGRSRRINSHAAEPKQPRSTTLRVLEALAQSGRIGLTLAEVSSALDVRDGASSGALSRLEAQGHCGRLDLRRNGLSVYVLAAHA